MRFGEMPDHRLAACASFLEREMTPSFNPAFSALTPTIHRVSLRPRPRRRSRAGRRGTTPPGWMAAVLQQRVYEYCSLVASSETLKSSLPCQKPTESPLRDRPHLTPEHR